MVCFFPKFCTIVFAILILELTATLLLLRWRHSIQILSHPVDIKAYINNYATVWHKTGNCWNKNKELSSINNTFHELQNNLILGAAFKLELSVLHRFVQSARFSCNFCTIALLVSRDLMNSTDFLLLIDIFKVTIISYEVFLETITHRNFQITDIRSQRWMIFSKHLTSLQKQGTAFHNVFICDVSDTIFQTNVFAHMNLIGDGLYAFLEGNNITIGEENLNSVWIETCYGKKALMKIANQPISCSGTVLGSWSAMVNYLSVMTTQMLSRSGACIQYGGSDQGIHNFIIHNRIVPNTTIHTIPHETGFVGTVGLANWLKRNRFGFVLNKKSKIYAVVHQINRSPLLESQYSSMYQTVPDNMLDRKA